jgi:hypothetical protein
MEAPGLALGADEFIAETQHQVVALVHTDRHQDFVAAADQLGEDRSLGPEANIHRMVAELRQS